MLCETRILCFNKNLLHCIMTGDLKMSKKTALPPKHEGGCIVDQGKDRLSASDSATYQLCGLGQVN